MSLYDYYTGQQSWSSYVLGRDLGERFEITGNKLAIRLNRDEQDKAIREGLGSLENSFKSGFGHLHAVREGLGSLKDSLTSGFGDLQYEVQNISSGIDRLNADFHILMGDVVWRLERQTEILKGILRAIQAPLDTAAKELRARAEFAYENGWHDKALDDFLESEKKNYQDFAVHRSIGNIYLYHLIDLPRSVGYFLQAAKYARPRDVKQAAESEYFAGVAFGLQQDFGSALQHTREAVFLNPAFYDAYYSCATFAMLLGQSDIVLDGLERAIRGDARYFERCKHDTCFDDIRSQINSLLARLLTEAQGEANARIAELKQTLKVLRQKGVANDVLEKCSARLTELEGLQKQGHYSALRVAAPRAHEALVSSLQDGVKSLDETAKQISNEMSGLRYQLTSKVHEIEAQRKNVEAPEDFGTIFAYLSILTFGAFLLWIGWPPFSNWFTALLSIITLIIGAICFCIGAVFLSINFSRAQKIDSLASQASAARLEIGRDEVLQRLEGEAAEVRENRGALSEMLAQSTVLKPAKLLQSEGIEPPTSPDDAKTRYTMILDDYGPDRINTIKAIREVTGLGLKEAYDLVNTAPSTIKVDVDRYEAEAIKAKFKAIGTKVSANPV